MAHDDAAQFRLTVVDQALRLFAERGYEATTVDEIAVAAGISRRTFFRQFRSKEDVIFADHEFQLALAAESLARAEGDAWDAVCEAVLGVFERFTQWRDIAARRYQVVRRVPALREREIVTVFRYERLFTDFLRDRLPEVPDLARVQFAAAVTATHNYLLRRMVRGEPAAEVADLRTELAAIPRGRREGPREELVVAVFPRDMPPREVADRITAQLGNL
ncbi:TetR family transcriptional regulator [Nocardia asteroides]|uniref:TetR family transcriptional regulator n=1 Tax=Nocardia asteroides NBRC 15531 TaxID=1110697 RepID=U5ENB6_NOCAS|nr:TetR family transcriptional regulator [Nocardia asteroides]TLF65692.1 TetR family transcriptional regulator [Nocardia asteroides NBRC 15531]UGT47540.1 TetR family transcriptional regulator [Nocardia asteroides]GAD87793.1 putative TetR family transcriptional regulator [Nocardia asteroides NBRC 15531]